MRILFNDEPMKCDDGLTVAALLEKLAQIKALFRQNNDAAAFRRFIGKRRELGGIRQRFFIHARGR